jgi:hypothetical protein
MSENLTLEQTRQLDRDEAAVIRATCHTVDPEALERHAQHWTTGVTDLDVARVFYALEQGVQPYRNRAGNWRAPLGSALIAMRHHLSVVVNEMIRTGLVRHYRDHEGDHLIPALVHFRNADNARLSACLFTGEDMGPMRSRLVDRLDLVDCLNCEAAVASGNVRGL